MLSYGFRMYVHMYGQLSNGTITQWNAIHLFKKDEIGVKWKVLEVTVQREVNTWCYPHQRHFALQEMGINRGSRLVSKQRIKDVSGLICVIPLPLRFRDICGRRGGRTVRGEGGEGVQESSSLQTQQGKCNTNPQQL